MTNIRECRICLSDSNDEESLIQPCRCNTAYVHESCLQKWRIENIDNEKITNCGADAHLDKPFKFSDLTLKIYDLITE